MVDALLLRVTGQKGGNMSALNIEEAKNMMQWVGENIENLPINEQLKIVNAFYKMAEEIQPIYTKYSGRKAVILWL